MILYNITMKVNPSIEEEWIKWQKEEHIPEIMSTGFFTDHKFLRLLEQDDIEGKTFAVQYFAKNMNDYQEYIDKHASNIRKKALQRWGDGFISFRTLMEVVQ
jgi:hypothetical protein